ncbi:MAG: ATP-binding protein [Betaproteobacteria bacterium]|nr:ATP-binding protein [Betaproteobacteria bacterium]
MPSLGLSIYVPKLIVNQITLYINQKPLWGLRDEYWSGGSLSATRISIPPALLRTGENTLHLQVVGFPRWFHGISRIYIGDNNKLSERAAIRNLLQSQMITIVAAAFGVIGLLSLWLWLRSGRDPVLFWYGVSGVVLLVASALWYVTLWRADFWDWRPGLIFTRLHGFLLPLFILHLRLAGRRNLWLEGALWGLLAAAIASVVIPSPWQGKAWVGWGIVFATLPALLTIPLLSSPRLRNRPSVLLLVAADFAAALLTFHDWATRIGLLDFERPNLAVYVAPFVMLAAAAPILERLMAGVAATRRMNVELEHRVAAKALEIEASHQILRVAQREQELAEERRRIMVDMHDGLGARLVSLLSIAQSGKARQNEISEGLAAALSELRLTVDSVQPVEGDVAVVLGNVRHRMRSVFERAGVKFLWNVSALPRMESLTPERILAIQRIFLEVFSNTLKHAGARTVAVSAVRLPGAVQIVIADDGRGFEEGEVHSGNGLANLKLRAAQAGGTIAVESGPGTGTRVTLTLPVPDEPTPSLPDTGQKDAFYPVQGIARAPKSA